MGDKANEDSMDEKSPMDQLEDAMVLCGFGRFHIKLLFITLVATFASTMVTTTSSYILPNVECDLGITIMQKGVLNAIPFFGLVASSLFTGFVIDAFGRKMFLVGGNFGIFLCCFLEGISQQYWMLLLWKLIEGVFHSLSFSAVTTMVSEFTPKHVRDRVILLTCSFMSLSLIMTALMSWAILPLPLDFIIVENYFELHSWNIYLIACSIWSLLAALGYYSLPESPKYLLSHGQDKEAVRVIMKIYKENNRNSKQPLKLKTFNTHSIGMPSSKQNSIRKQLTDAFFESKELFKKPLLYRLLLIATITFVCLLAYSSFRLWYPQLSTIVENYEKDNGHTERYCIMMNNYNKKLHATNNATLLMSSNENITSVTDCIPQRSGTETYTNGILLGVVSLTLILVTASLVDYVGQKPLMFTALILSSISSILMYWSRTSIQVALIVSFTCALGQSALSLQQNIIVRVFPTKVRSLAFSLIIMCGRIGSLLGNILFPVLLEAGCMGPFIALSAVSFAVAGLVYFLPNPKKDNVNGDQ